LLSQVLAVDGRLVHNSSVKWLEQLLGMQLTIIGLGAEQEFEAEGCNLAPEAAWPNICQILVFVS